MRDCDNRSRLRFRSRLRSRLRLQKGLLNAGLRHIECIMFTVFGLFELQKGLLNAGLRPQVSRSVISQM